MATAAQFNLTRAIMIVGHYMVGRMLLSCVHSSIFGAQENDMTDNSFLGESQFCVQGFWEEKEKPNFDIPF